MSDDNKVVPFPIHKVKRSAQGPEASLGRPGRGNRRAMLLVSLVSTVLFATMMVNKVTQNPQREDSGRGLASVENAEGRRDFTEDLLWAKRIARQSLREPSSVGRAPSLEEVLRNSELANSYAMKFDDEGHLMEIDYRGPPGDERRLTKCEDFLMRFEDLFPVSFDRAARNESIREKDRHYDVYGLMAGNTPKANVHFTMGSQDQLISMKVELLPDATGKSTDK